MISVRENRIDQAMAFEYRSMHCRSVRLASASCIAVCAVVVRYGKHGVSELYVVFVNALEEAVLSELPDIVLSSCCKDCGDTRSGPACPSFLLIGVIIDQ